MMFEHRKSLFALGVFRTSRPALLLDLSSAKSACTEGRESRPRIISNLRRKSSRRSDSRQDYILTT
jgi:hypothetical protein